MRRRFSRVTMGRLLGAALGLWLGLALGPAPAGAANVLEVIEQNGPAANRIDLVIVGDGFTAAEAGVFRTKVDALVQGLFGETPWSGYRGLFNLYRVVTPSNESGADHPAQGIARDTYYDAQFDYYGIARLTYANVSRITSVVTGLLPEVDQIVLLINDPAYGGSGGTVAMLSTHASAVSILVHELGHSFGHLADEYTDSYPGYPAGDPEPNVDYDATRALLKWDAWITASTPLPTALSQATSSYLPVGAYEGARYFATGIYRSAPHCLMQALSYDYCDVCREAMVLGFYAEVDPLDGASPAGAAVTVDRNRPELLPLAFTADAVLPAAGSPLEITWSLDGQPVATGPTFDFDPAAAGVADGTHTLRCEVLDPTAWVRDDPQQRLRSERSWTVLVTSSGTVGPDASVPSGGPDASVPSGGPDASVPSGGPDASVPSGGQDASVPSGGPDASVPSGGPDASVPSGGQDASVPSGGEDASVPSGGPDASVPSGGEDASVPSGGEDASVPSGGPDASVPASSLERDLGSGSPRVVGGCAAARSGGGADALLVLLLFLALLRIRQGRRRPRGPARLL